MAALSPAAPDAAHRADHVVTAQGPDEAAASKSTAAVAVQDAAGDIPAAGHRTGQRCRGQS